MKIIIFSDIHANLPAFEKALESIYLQKPDAIYCLGDLVGYNIWPNEVIDIIRSRRIATIAGNHDAKVKSLSSAKMDEPGKNYAYKIITEDNKKYLATLPSHLKVEFKLIDSSLTMLLVHGSPNSNDEYLLEDKDEHEFLQVFENANADILFFGHSHKPYYRILDSKKESSRYKYAINTGSVGKPKDGNPQGGYTMITIHENTSALDPQSLKVDFIRFGYDVETAATAIENSPLPNEFAEMLRKAY